MVKLAYTLVSAIALSIGVTACGTSGDEAGAAESDVLASIGVGTFKLYRSPRHDPDAGCDVHTQLSLSDQPSGARAALVEGVDGVCELHVEPNARDYRLRLVDTACGSRTYRATRQVGGRAVELTLVDHRTRVCDDIVEARIIVEERDGTNAPVRLFSHDEIAPEPAPGWLTIDPVQCGNNPWADVKPTDAPSALEGEARAVDVFLREGGIGVDQIGFAAPTEAFGTCAACSCPRGDHLIVHARSAADAKRLTEIGFRALDGALVQSPTQCGTNPWESGSPAKQSEARALGAWAASVDAPVKIVGFVQPTEAVAVCLACQCPRGDTAIVVPMNALASSKLQDAFGWRPAS